MGNVEIIDQRKPQRSPIFKDKDNRTPRKSKLKQILSNSKNKSSNLSPIRYKDGLSTERKTQLSVSHLQKSSILEEEGSKSKRMSQIIEQEPPEINLHSNTNYNKIKCKQIVKKVRNFNDFLNEIKNKLKEENQMYRSNEEQNNVNLQRQDSNESIGRSQSKIMKMSLKLQNQKIELEKYKQLVEKELSKNHSIENITIENTKSGEKILKIQYQNIKSSKKDLLRVQSAQEKVIKENILKQPLQKQQIVKNQSEECSELIQQQNEVSTEYKIAKAKRLYELMVSKVQTIGKMIEIQENQNASSDKNLANLMKMKEKNARANSLLKKTEMISMQNQKLQNQILALIEQKHV